MGCKNFSGRLFPALVDEAQGMARRLLREWLYELLSIIFRSVLNRFEWLPIEAAYLALKALCLLIFSLIILKLILTYMPKRQSICLSTGGFGGGRSRFWHYLNV